MPSDKVAIVTGAAGGIGRSICLELARRDCKVICSDIDLNGARIIADKIKSTGKQAIAVQTDVSNHDSVVDLCRVAKEHFGRSDILVNAAGIIRDGKIVEISEKDWDDVMNVDLKGVFLTSQTFARELIEDKRGGAIVNISSVSGLMPIVNSGAYSPSKAGVIMLTRLMAVEWGQYKIRVNCVCPGAIITSMTDEFYKGELREARIEVVPVRRFGETDEVAKLVAFLASEDASYISGSSITIDGAATQSVSYSVELLAKEKKRVNDSLRTLKQ